MGPQLKTGLMTDKSKGGFSVLMKSQAAFSARVFEAMKGTKEQCQPKSWEDVNEDKIAPL